MNLGIQLYSLRDIVNDDPAGLLRRVARMGYREVEFAGYYGLPSGEMKKLLDDTGLTAVSTHIGYEALTERLKQEIEYNLAVGVHDIVLAWSPMENPEDVRRIADGVGKAAQIAAPYGVRIGYHNHGHEFSRTENGERYIDLFARSTDPAVQLEFDVYWVTYGGADPLEYVRKYVGRQSLMHLKEMAADEPMRNVEIGDGKIDFKSLITLGKSVGVKHFIVEQEAYTMPVVDSCTRSFQGIEKLGVL